MTGPGFAVSPPELEAAAGQITPVAASIDAAKITVVPATQGTFDTAPLFTTSVVAQWFGEQMEATLSRQAEVYRDHAHRLRVQASEYVRNEQSTARSFG